MPDDKKTQEFLKKLAPCIERGEFEKCVEGAARAVSKYLPDFPDKTVLFIGEKQ